MTEQIRGRVVDDVSTRGTLPAMPSNEQRKLPQVNVSEEPPTGEPGESMVDYCLRGFHEDEKSHRVWCQKVDINYRAFRGIMERRSEAAGWTNKQRPAVVYQAMDTLLAGLLDPSPEWKLRARPKMLGLMERPNLQQLTDGARANEMLLADQTHNDCYGEKQTLYMHQNLVAGLTVAKNIWKSETGPGFSTKIESVPIYAPNSGQIIGFRPRAKQSQQGEEIYFDGPSFEPTDVRDFIWHQSAPSLDKCIRVTHRVWKDFTELKELERQGVYKNVDKLKETQGQSDTLHDRETDLFQIDRTKDKIEVLECWIDHGRRVVSLGNRSVVLRDVPNPYRFDHLPNRYPFVICSTSPDIFRIPGIGEVEIVRELQEILWTLLNQRIDNLQLINNAIILLREDMDDPDSFDFYPGARNLVSDPQAVQMWTPNINIANLSIEAENLVRGDLQNIIGASPALQGQMPSDTNTATQANLVTTLAQRRLSMKKQMTKWSAKRTGEQWLALNQQMLKHDRYVPIVGQGGELSMATISPLLIQGRYQIDVEEMDESLMRQERRAEAQAKLQVAVQAAPAFAASGTPLNLQAFMDDYLSQFDVADKERYFQAPEQQQQSPAGMPGQPPGGPPMPTPGGSQGITSPSASDEQSPSHAFSMSGTMPMARALASRGGAVNIGQNGR